MRAVVQEHATIDGPVYTLAFCDTPLHPTNSSLENTQHPSSTVVQQWFSSGLAQHGLVLQGLAHCDVVTAGQLRRVRHDGLKAEVMQQRRRHHRH